MNLTWEPQPEGWKAMDGPHLVCRLTTRSQRLEKVDTNSGPQSVVKWDPMDPKDWTIHFAYAHMPLETMKAAYASLPKTA
jgi:hypothetical protein